MALLANMRHPYHGEDSKFEVHNLASLNPVQQFKAWLDDVCREHVVDEPNAMAVATCTKSGVPSVRMILCKEFSEEGFTFFTNYDSKKGRELTENPFCSLMFYWEPVKRMVRIEGKAEKVPQTQSQQYFESRPKDSQLGALVSRQSTVIPNRETLDKRLEELRQEYADDKCSKPDYWGGFLVRPYEFEFWQGQTNRLHDRLRFRKLSDGESFNSDLMTQGDGDWIIERLSS